MKNIKFHTKGGKFPLILLPLIVMFVIILMSFFAVVGVISMLVIGVIGLGISIFRSLKSKQDHNTNNYDRKTNTITLEKKDYDIE